MQIEVIKSPSEQAQAQPVLFVHGIFTGAWIWQEHFLPWFAEQGYHAWALSLRGHGGSEGHQDLHHWGLDDYVADLTQVAAKMELAYRRKPLIVGHSMGGMVVQRYLSKNQGAGAVLLCSMPPQGLVPLSWQSLLQHPRLTLEMGQTYLNPNLASRRQLQEILFHHPMPEEDLDRWLAQMGAESRQLLWDLSWGALPNIYQVQRTPLAVIGARHDRLVPTTMVSMTGWSYALAPLWLEEMGHGVMLEPNWQQAAHLIKAQLDTMTQFQQQTACA
ncbi:non-heme chloroperoxidase [Allopseudospirillum japonicum]|uniref:Non-heme chloroperoxidase n=1 Tax=Allopseudospirillum japonicum TaxID=64971 RepID=A0A1H6TPD0_9GAMM|nr:alpha/beta fold hydrolase [Allopseudospirillum japonicum]SEI81136.1 non-heme chloroperoxidase [Allopseudospirillum japonicum]